MIEMKPCPFCGEPGMYDDAAMGDALVCCSQCGASGPSAATDDAAAERWNTRQNISDVLIEALVTKALCQSGKFETGQGTCAAICMEVLGSARGGPHGCPNAARVHGKLAASIADALRQAKGEAL